MFCSVRKIIVKLVRSIANGVPRQQRRAAFKGFVVCCFVLLIIITGRRNNFQADIVKNDELLFNTFSNTFEFYHTMMNDSLYYNNSHKQAIVRLTTNSSNVDTNNEVQNFTDWPDFLDRELQKKLHDAKNIESLGTVTCQHLNIDYKSSCNISTPRDCPQETLPSNTKDRIRQLVARDNLQVAPVYFEALSDMRKAVPGFYEVLIISAMSSNHYLEGQAMLKNLHEDVFPVLKNFTLVIYDLGLSEEERNNLQLICRCTLIQFPFHRFPAHFHILKCFGWKTAVIRAHYDSANFIIWTDTSIRIHNSSALPIMLEQARVRGIQQRRMVVNNLNPFHTLLSMFEFFGDSPCAHISFPQVETGYGIYHREPLVQRAILDPWYACALTKQCICPGRQHEVQRCPGISKQRHLGLCMRNEQSAMSIILAKLFQDKYRYAVVDFEWFQVVSRGK